MDGEVINALLRLIHQHLGKKKRGGRRPMRSRNNEWTLKDEWSQGATSMVESEWTTLAWRNNSQVMPETSPLARSRAS